MYYILMIIIQKIVVQINFLKIYLSLIERITRTDKPQMLFLSDNYYPGWKAYIDDKETKIFRANYTFRAIYLPEGSHLVKFVYQPLSFKVGVVISFLAILTILVIIYLKINRMRILKKFI